AEAMAVMSLATDVSMGQPMEESLAVCLLATRLADELGLSDADRVHVYYTALLRHIGCTADMHVLAAVAGDDISMRNAFVGVDLGRPVEMFAAMMRHIGRTYAPLERPAAVVRVMAATGKFRHGGEVQCEVAEMLAGRLGFDESFQRDISSVLERWDGKGFPGKVGGEEITMAARVVGVAELAALSHRMDGPEAALDVLRRRSGKAFDPAVVEGFVSNGTKLFAALETASPWDGVLEVEPGERPMLSGRRLDEALRAMGDFADLKSPYTVGHSSGVADLAARAAERCGLPPGDVIAARRAGWVHDIGRVAVSSAIWDKPGPLTRGEWEKVRLHPYHADRVLARQGFLDSLGRIASMHHERLDGSGYFRQAPAGQQPPIVRVLAVADAYHAMTEPRPHRPAMTPEQAAAELRAEIKAGRLDAEAVRGVLDAAGMPVGRRAEQVAGLTVREVQVLRLLARGQSIRDIARTLQIAPKTADAHIQHIYTKAGVSSRAAATLFAMQHDLVAPHA
ncbi:MAG TPA: HD domain-containing phosphohydrolase, partial [Actinomycetota bacterium]|nr:HD domain-containing phosphohydrolase [Actinomycetota bacterium]